MCECCINDVGLSCDSCGKWFNWSGVIKSFPTTPDLSFLINFLKKLNLPEEFLAIKSAYNIRCGCGNEFTACEIGEGEDAGYLTFGFVIEEVDE